MKGDPWLSVVTNATDPVAAAIAHHLKIAGELMTATRNAKGEPSLSNVDVIARLDLILAKLEEPAVPVEHRLWDIRELADYLHRHPETARSMTALPDFPMAISLPGRGAGRGKLLYRATEIVAWAASYQEKRRR